MRLCVRIKEIESINVINMEINIIDFLLEIHREYNVFSF